MPKEVEDKLRARAARKGLKGKRKRAYIYGTMKKLRLLNTNPIFRRLTELAAKIDLGERYDNSGCYPRPVSEKPEPIHYPTFYISGKKKPIPLPAKGRAIIDYRVKNVSMNKNGEDDERHSTDIEIHSIEPIEEEEKPVKEGEAARLLGDLRKVTGFNRSHRSHRTYFDSRPRNENGQFIGNETGGVDPNSMAAAYGPPGAEPVDAMAEPHLERIKRFFLTRRSRSEGGSSVAA